jgi:HEAT repeat protein
MSETTEPLVLSADQTRAVVSLSRAFLSGARIWTMYPPDHPTARTAAGRLQEAIDVAVEARVASAITVMPTSLLVRGMAVPEGDQAIADMAALLHGHGILEIGFDPAVPADAPARLLAFLGRAPGSFEEQGGVSQAWAQQGHPAIRIEAVDYRKVLEDRDPDTAAPRRDDVWRAIVSALASGRRTLDEREQERLLELAEDPGELAALAETLMAGKCTAGGSPMVMTQAATVLASFRHLASMASVLAPDRAHAILQNLGDALVRIDPRVSAQIVTMDAQGGGAGPLLSGAFTEDGVAQLLATLLAFEGQASPRLAQVFDLLVPEPGRRRGVLEQARAIAQRQHTGDRPFGAFWNSIENLLLSYNDGAFVSNEYRAVLDGAGGASGTGDQATPASLAELNEWLATVSEDHLRQMSIVLLGDLLRLETRTDRAVVVLNQLADLADDLLLAGLYDDTLRVLEAIEEGAERADLTTPIAQALQRTGGSQGVQEAAAVLGELRPGDWATLGECFRRIGDGCLDALRGLVLATQDSTATERAGDVFVSIGEGAIEPLVGMLAGSPGTVCRRIATLLGRIASPSAVPALQPLLRAADSRVIQAAVRALAGIDDPAAARALHIALRTADGGAREKIVDALVGVADRRVVPMLVLVLDSSRPLGADYQVALHALDALARLQDARAVRSIAVVLFLRGWFLRSCFSRRRLRALKRAAARALARIGDPAALQALDRARRTGDRLLRRVAREVHVPPVEGVA